MTKTQALSEAKDKVFAAKIRAEYLRKNPNASKPEIKGFDAGIAFCQQLERTGKE